MLDILPTYEHFRRADMQFGLGYWHWFFLAQPFDVPERIIGADPPGFFTRGWPRGDDGTPVPPPYFASEALDDYLQCYVQPGTVHATCEDYRAGATYDYALDEADHSAGRRIAAPLLVLWARGGALQRWYDVLQIWRDWADDVRGTSVDAGHYLPEEAPDETFAQLRDFFAT